MSLFGWELEELIKKKKLIILKPEIYKFDTIKQIIRDAIDKIGAKRLVVDSYSVLLTYFNDPYEIRNGLVQLDREIKKMDCTAMVISDIKDNSEIFSTTGVEEFIVDGVIVLHLLHDPRRPLEYERAISVRKMRATHHPLRTYPFDISLGGISITGSVSSVHEPKQRRAAAQRAPKKAKGSAKARPEKKKSGQMVALSSLRAQKPGHSWKWKHL